VAIQQQVMNKHFDCSNRHLDFRASLAMTDLKITPNTNTHTHIRTQHQHP
jgi:hypothetical protein